MKDNEYCDNCKHCKFELDGEINTYHCKNDEYCGPAGYCDEFEPI